MPRYLITEHVTYLVDAIDAKEAEEKFLQAPHESFYFHSVEGREVELAWPQPDLTRPTAD